MVTRDRPQYIPIPFVVLLLEKKTNRKKKTPEKSVTIVAAAIERNKAKDMLL